MNQQVTRIDDDVFTIADVLTAEECSTIFSRMESIGFEAASVRTSAGPQMMPEIRNNDRVVFQDDELADLMWQRIESLLPDLDGQRPCGVDRLLRVYRYVPGQQFRRHKDGMVTNDLGQNSKLSYLVYLNDDCEGGATKFRDYSTVDGQRTKIETDIVPTRGMALLFRHERWHEGTEVICGAKYVLRTDVFYVE